MVKVQGLLKPRPCDTEKLEAQKAHASYTTYITSSCVESKGKESVVCGCLLAYVCACGCGRCMPGAG